MMDSETFMKHIVGWEVKVQLGPGGVYTGETLNLHQLAMMILEEAKNSEELYQAFAERFRRENHVVEPNIDWRIWGSQGEIKPHDYEK